MAVATDRRGKGVGNMDNRILVPLDGSSLAEQALPCAVSLARGLPADLDLLRTVWIPPDILDLIDESTVELNAIATQLEAEASDYLGGLVRQLEDAGLNTRHAVRRGPTAESILDYAHRAKVSHIIMATHGYSGIRRWTHGSVAERVLQVANVPLLLVRVSDKEVEKDWRQPTSCRRILVPLDGSPLAEQILPVAASMATALRGELALFRVAMAQFSGGVRGEWHVPMHDLFEGAEEDALNYLDAVARRLAQEGLDVTTTMAVGPVANCIVDYAEANRIDFIAMCTHGRTGLARWALGSVADRVLRAGSMPILLVRVH